MRAAGARHFAVICLAAALTACAVGPDYERPELPLPEDWRVMPAEAVELANAEWWTELGDPVLDELIATALAQNLDVRLAAARVARFSAGLQAARSGLMPQLGYGIGAERSRTSELLLPAGADPYSTQYQAALSASWQLDLFGRVQRESEAAQARVYASYQAQLGVMLSLTASVASAYVGLRALDRQLEIARATAANYEGTLEIFRLRHREGVVSRLEVAQVESQYQQAAAIIPLLEGQIAAQENLLSILLGETPEAIPRGRALAEFIIPPVPAALPSELLERRPDVLQAEQNLVAANADVGAAKALYFPEISLTGALGQVSAALGDLTDSAARSWSVGAAIAGPLFTGGAVSAQVAAAEAAREEALLSYEATVLEALREVNDALAGVTATAGNYVALSRRADALREYSRLARMRFDAGAASFLEVLYADNELFAAELEAVAARQAQQVNMITLYRALGGGWNTAENAVAEGGM